MVGPPLVRVRRLPPRGRRLPYAAVLWVTSRCRPPVMPTRSATARLRPPAAPLRMLPAGLMTWRAPLVAATGRTPDFARVPARPPWPSVSGAAATDAATSVPAIAVTGCGRMGSRCGFRRQFGSRLAGAGLRAGLGRGRNRKRGFVKGGGRGRDERLIRLAGLGRIRAIRFGLRRHGSSIGHRGGIAVIGGIPAGGN